MKLKTWPQRETETKKREVVKVYCKRCAMLLPWPGGCRSSSQTQVVVAVLMLLLCAVCAVPGEAHSPQEIVPEIN